jgi:dienelactone hydrolase
VRQAETFVGRYQVEDKFLEIKHEMVWVRPKGNGPFPLAVISHGAPRRTDAKAYREFRPQSFDFIAEDMARRGWAAAVFMRRGYGASSGSASEGYGDCSNPNFVRAGEQTALDFSNAIGALSKSTFVDAGTIVAIGHSAGGFGALSLSGQKVPGLRAVINFGGGRASVAPNEICGKVQILNAFREFGLRTRVPSLWIYASNDTFFEPMLVQEFFDNFTQSTMLAQLRFISAVPGDGHSAIQRKGGAQWRPILDNFLGENGLRTWKYPPDDPICSTLRIPSQMPSGAQRAWKEYECSEYHRAFALNRRGSRFGWASGRRSIEEAIGAALNYCENGNASQKCEIISTDDGTSN